ncbi:IclR family transcriptional regulator [Rhodococcus sp. Eu-32]|uniref:IclR family transcriptional regulator n=1 Tax=unclassified Rhodococcus (in: high G+C Gram-positive bacteria) TaxID=192944 RepID=UPI000DF1C8A8|nr:IclR family transcriptional regulator [Rhodococcus sp. Eu-32]NIL76976.1 Transcriptional regulator KdgR [Rhodococcus sp. B10]RRQ25256.1 IclR family transcriptional regulator [Rhodococcus sp. Eu-32]
MATLQTVQKIGPVLDLFTVERPEWGVSEVANTIDLPRSSAHALLSSLVDIGLLQCRARGRYRIGWRVVELGQALRGTVDVRTCAAPVLDRLVENYGETTHLAVMERNRVLYVDKVLGTHNITVQGARVGTRLDAYCTAVGKVLLAQLHHVELARFLDTTTLRRRTPTTITSAAGLVEALDAVRSAGCAFDLGEAVADVDCVAAPVRDDMGQVVAAISMSVPASRFVANRVEFHRAVVGAANEVTRALAEVAEAVVPLGRNRTTAPVQGRFAS